MSKKRVAKVFKPWPLFLLFRFTAPANWKNRFAPASVLDHCKFEESLRSEQFADLVAAEQQEE